MKLEIEAMQDLSNESEFAFQGLEQAQKALDEAEAAISKMREKLAIASKNAHTRYDVVETIMLALERAEANKQDATTNFASKLQSFETKPSYEAWAELVAATIKLKP